LNKFTDEIKSGELDLEKDSWHRLQYAYEKL